MISRRYKLIYDTANCIMIYLLGLAAGIGACAVMRRSFSWTYAIVSAIILALFVAFRLFIPQIMVSAVAHIAVIGLCWFVFVSKAADPFSGIVIVAFAALLAAIDVFADFYKKKNQSYGEIHVIACALFLPVYAYIDYVANKLGASTDMTEAKYGATCGIFGTVICIICILFFGLTLVRAYMKNAIKLADNSQIDENAPVNYMYGNSNKFIGPIIACIVAIMLVIQSKTSSNIFASMWLGLLGGVAGVCNLFSVNSDSPITGTTVAPAGSTLFIVEVVIAAIIILAIVVAIAIIVTKIYKSHWHKDLSSDETLESAAMVEKREWIYHKASKKSIVAEDTSVTKAQEIAPTVEETAPVKEEIVEPITESSTTVVEIAEEVTEVAEEVTEVAEEVTEAAQEVAEEVEATDEVEKTTAKAKKKK